MSSVNLVETLHDLNSPYWKIRLSAAGELKLIGSSKDCLSLYRMIEKEDDNSLRFSFLQVLDDFLLRQNGELEGAALFCLVNYTQRENKKVAARAKKVIDSFIHSPDIIRYRKLSAVRSAWHLLTLEKRKYLTSIILTNKLTELVPLIVLNFKSRDDDLIRRTIDGLRNFGDSRGNQYIKIALHEGSKPVRISSVKALGELGSVLDYKSVKRCLYDSDSAIQVAAVSAYGKLLGRFAYKGLIKLFYSTSRILVKKEILSHFGKQKTKNSLQFIVDHYLGEEEPNILLYCEWALYESRYPKKIELLLRYFEKADLGGKYKLLGFLSGLFDPKLVGFYAEIIEEGADPLLSMTVIDSLSNYSDPQSIRVLRDVLGDFKGDYSTYALLSLFKIKEVETEALVDSYISSDIELKHTGHEVILKALKNYPKNSEEGTRVRSYLEKVVSEGSLNQKVLALETAHFFISVGLYRKILDLLQESQSEVLQQTIYKTLVKMISLDPDLLDEGHGFFNNPLFAELFLSRKASPDIVRKIGLIFFQKPLDFAVHFLYLHGRNLSTRFMDNILLYSDDRHVDFYLSFMDKNAMTLKRKSILLLQREFYAGSSNARKLSILSISCLNPDQANFSFFYEKVNELFKDQDLRYELTGHYIRGLCE